MIHPNVLTVFRILLAFFFPPLILSSNPFLHFLAFWVFLVAGLSDWWDGALARKTNRVTNTGKILDPIADKVLNLGAMASFASLGAYPFWLIIPVFIREIFITLIRIRCVARGEVLAAELSGKIKTTLQYASILFSYCYIMSVTLKFPGLYLKILYGLNLAGMVAALGMTLYSGYLFFKDKPKFEKGIEALATCCYTGFLPTAPGTWGSLAGVLFFVFFSGSGQLYIAALILFTALAIWAAGRYQKTTRSKDPGEVVADEFVGMLVTYWVIPKGWVMLIAGFLLFRLFDIVKPLFIRRVEKLPGGWGIVLDDLLAGVYANVVLRTFLWIFKINL